MAQGANGKPKAKPAGNPGNGLVLLCFGGMRGSNEKTPSIFQLEGQLNAYNVFCKSTVRPDA